MAADDANPALKKLLLRARYCETCCAVEREGHAHGSRTEHPVRLLTPEEKASLEKQWREEQDLGEERSPAAATA